MLRSKTTVFGMIAALLLVTSAFTALSADSQSSASDIDEFLLVNGHEVEESDYAARVATVEQNLVMLSAQAEGAPEGNTIAESLLEILETTPPETIALASLILDMAIYQEAIDRGYLPDANVIAQQVEQERELFETIEADPAQFGADEVAVESYRENIDEIGEERYWNEFYPQLMEQQIAVQELQVAISQEAEDWISLQQQVFTDADVQIGDPEHIAPATIADAGTYQNRVWDVYQSQ